MKISGNESYPGKILPGKRPFLRILKGEGEFTRDSDSHECSRLFSSTDKNNEITQLVRVRLVIDTFVVRIYRVFLIVIGSLCLSKSHAVLS